MKQESIETPPALTVMAWRDALVESRGHRSGSAYIETVWAGVLGPTATLLWSRLARLAAVRPAARIDRVDLARSLGLGDRLGPHGPLSRSLSRMVAFGAAIRSSAEVLMIRLALPDVPAHQLGRLSVSGRIAHQRRSRQAAPKPVVPEPTPVPELGS
jgi:hypothetical protein